MILTTNMAITGKGTKFTHKVAKVNLFEHNHQQDDLATSNIHQNTHARLLTLHNPRLSTLRAHTVCAWRVSALGCMCVAAVGDYWCKPTSVRGRLLWLRSRLE